MFLIDVIKVEIFFQVQNKTRIKDFFYDNYKFKIYYNIFCET